MNRLSLLAGSLLLTLFSYAQPYWAPIESSKGIISHKSVARESFPKEYKLFRLNADNLRQIMFAVVDGKGNGQGALIQLPNVDGGLEEFRIFEASNFEPALQRQFPLIRAFSGKGVTDPASTLKISISPQGVQAMVFRADKPSEFLEAYSADATVYAVFRSQRNKGSLNWTCSTPEADLVAGLNAAVQNQAIVGRSGGDLKTMRLAQSCNGEYSNYFGATSAAQVNLVLAAFNNTLTRCNGVYEKDLALHLNLIASTTNVIYYSPSTDPYTTMSSWNSQLQSTLNSVIGAANYDIGHMFGASGGGGNAGCIGCVCSDANKGSGITSPADGIPQGDNFDIDYVVHEVGHQLGANHTFSMSNEGTGVNKEVGSGITIMGYAGITAQDVAPHSIDIFHQASIQQIQTNLATKTCPVTYSMTGTNSTPVVNAGADYVIPKSTPFELTGTATDANSNDVLTYCWEQNDNSTTTGTSSVASATKATGPNWISFPPTTNPTRVFPKLATILAGGLVSGPLTGGDAGANTEALSSVARTLNFRLTVRDNSPYSSVSPYSVGQTQFDDVIVTVNGTAGPFAITSQSTATTWAAGSSQTITWSIGGTTAAPINTANVDILFSSDGGNNFTLLLANTPNDGSEVITAPNTQTTNGRIKVKAVGNIYFDINNANITVSAPPVCGVISGLSASNVTYNTADISWAALSGATGYDVEYKVTSSATWIAAATATTSTTLNLTGLLQSTTYDWRVRPICLQGTGNFSTAQFVTATPCVAPTGTSTTLITSSSAQLNWAAVPGASNYTVEYRLSSVSTWTVAASANTTLNVALTGLTASTAYVWRVRSNCSLNAVYSAEVSFSTTAPVCISTYDVSTNGTTTGAAIIPFNTNIPGSISSGTDIDYYKFTISRAGTISLSLINLPANYNLRLYRGTNTTPLVTSSQTGTTSEAINNYSANKGTYYAQVFGATTSDFNASSCYTLRVSLGTAAKGAEIDEPASLSVFPNPVVRSFTLQGLSQSQTSDVFVYNASGQLITQRLQCLGTQNLDLSKHRSGIYWIKVISGETTQTIKLIKQ